MTNSKEIKELAAFIDQMDRNAGKETFLDKTPSASEILTAIILLSQELPGIISEKHLKQGSIVLNQPPVENLVLKNKFSFI